MNVKSGMLQKFMQCRPPFHFGTSIDEFEVVTFNVLSMVGIVCSQSTIHILLFV